MWWMARYQWYIKQSIRLLSHLVGTCQDQWHRWWDALHIILKIWWISREITNCNHKRYRYLDQFWCNIYIYLGTTERELTVLGRTIKNQNITNIHTDFNVHIFCLQQKILWPEERFSNMVPAFSDCDHLFHARFWTACTEHSIQEDHFDGTGMWMTLIWPGHMELKD